MTVHCKILNLNLPPKSMTWPPSIANAMANNKAFTLAVANLKGGCGKTTISTNISAGLTQRGRVGLVDADPQGALKHWVDWGSKEADAQVPVLYSDHTDPVQNLKLAQPNHDFVVVDCPPSLDMAITCQLMIECDFVLIPVLPSPLDLWASTQTIDMIERARKTNPKLKAALVLNQTEPRSAMSRAMQTTIERLGVPVLTTSVRRRAVYRNAVVEGVSVFQLGARGRSAADEINQILNEVIPS
ncbi:MAG: hypothetical protein B7X44_01165 [Halothiobacillus sp. 15-55-196]|nr:MAG: hypothetical protein B7X44_01165 [Halothiobacillus sp. 15-55-196]